MLLDIAVLYLVIGAILVIIEADAEYHRRSLVRPVDPAVFIKSVILTILFWPAAIYKSWKG